MMPFEYKDLWFVDSCLLDDAISTSTAPNICYLNDIELYYIILDAVYAEERMFNQDRIQVFEISSSDSTSNLASLSTINSDAPLQLQTVSSSNEQIPNDNDLENNAGEEVDGNRLIVQNEIIVVDDNHDHGLYIEVDELFQN